MATVQKRGNSYKITVSCGYDLNGKQLRQTITWKPPAELTARQEEKELAHQVALFEEKCRTGTTLNGNIKFAHFAEIWFRDYAAAQLRPKTLARYHALMPRINAAIGHIRLDRLKPQQLLSFYANLQETGIRADTKYRYTGDFAELLQAKGLNRTAAAKLCGISTAVINSLTQGKNITATSADKVSRELNISPADFEPVNADKTLSNKTVLHHHRLISSILATAVQWQVILYNPCDRVKPPKVEHTEAVYLDEHQTAELLELLQAEELQNRVMITLLLFTGLRRGELLGLEWNDIDFANNLLHIKRSSLYLSDKGIFTDETKNETSTRTIKISVSVMELLREFKTWQTEQRLMIGSQWQPSNRLFTAWNGKPLHPDTLSGWFSDFIRKSNLPHITIHSLRHTNATLQIAAGVPLTTVAKRLGHANTTTTARIYAHAIRSADEAAAETLENILLPKKA